MILYNRHAPKRNAQFNLTCEYSIDRYIYLDDDGYEYVFEFIHDNVYHCIHLDDNL